MSRRTLLKRAIASLLLASPLTRPSAAAGTDGFVPLTHSTEDKLLLPDGYQSDVLIRWGDPVLPDTPGFDPRAQQPALQARQFGYNADFIGFLPLPVGSGNSEHGLLVVNHEYTNPELMFADWDGKDESKTREMVDIELAAHGLSVIEIQRDAKGGWSYTQNSSFNRRLTAQTLIVLSGPAAGHSWLKTSSDTSGTRVQGTLNNCAAGVTPWGTVLTAEENFQQYFGGSVEAIGDQAVQALHKRYEVRDEFGWGRHYDRFDVTKEPHEPLRFGWIVEIDPYDPTSMPLKRTALGRFRHEAATTVINKDGPAVVYMGDDGRFEYLYKFVTTGRYDPNNRAATIGLLDAGTLYVAKFHDDGTGEWMPLIFGQGPLIAANGFNSQGDVLIGTRRAADLLQATKMDRPEDVEANHRSGKVYVVMTNNTQRTPEQVDTANPRPENKHGHIIELVEDGGEHTATTFGWDLFIACGDPNNPVTMPFTRDTQTRAGCHAPITLPSTRQAAYGSPPTAKPRASRRMMRCTSLRLRVRNVGCPRCSSAVCQVERSAVQPSLRIIGRSSSPSNTLVKRKGQRSPTPSVASRTILLTCRRDQAWWQSIVPTEERSEGNNRRCAGMEDVLHAPSTSLANPRVVPAYSPRIVIRTPHPLHPAHLYHGHPERSKGLLTNAAHACGKHRIAWSPVRCSELRLTPLRLETPPVVASATKASPRQVGTDEDHLSMGNEVRTLDH